MFRAPIIAELLVPDARFEVDDRSRAWLVLDWPLVVAVGDVSLASDTDAAHPAAARLDRLGASLSLEPEWRPRSGDLRLRAGGRAALGTFFGSGTILVDAGALIGTDGSGGYVGAGLGAWESGFSAGVLVRRTWTTRDARVDLLFDVAIPLQLFAL